MTFTHLASMVQQWLTSKQRANRKYVWLSCYFTLYKKEPLSNKNSMLLPPQRLHIWYHVIISSMWIRIRRLEWFIMVWCPQTVLQKSVCCLKCIRGNIHEYTSHIISSFWFTKCKLKKTNLFVFSTNDRYSWLSWQAYTKFITRH
jgi:hypothetical protein